jgi:hypothetical protein
MAPVPISATASLLEIGWTALAVPGLLLSIHNLVGAVGDIRYHWSDGLRALGVVGAAKEGAVLLMTLLVLASGMAAMVTPPRPETQDTAAFVAGCLIGVDVLTLVLAVAFWVERRVVVPHVHGRHSEERR